MREGERWEWIADSYPANAVSLRSVADGNFVVVDRTDGRQVIIAEVDYSSAPLMLYEGAIHMVQSHALPGRAAGLGRPQGLRHAHARRLLHRRDRLHQAQGARALRRRASPGAGTCHHGEVHVVRRVAGYKKIRYYTHENIGYGPVNLPDQEMHTSALWWQLPQATLRCALRIAAGRARRLPRRGVRAARGGEGRGDGRCARPAEGGRQRRRRVVRHRRTAAGAGSCAAPMAGVGDPRRARSLRADGVSLRQLSRRRGPERTVVAAPARAASCCARELVERCDCKAGCPACVGPVLDDAGGRGDSPRALALRVLGRAGGAHEPHARQSSQQLKRQAGGESPRGPRQRTHPYRKPLPRDARSGSGARTRTRTPRSNTLRQLLRVRAPRRALAPGAPSIARCPASKSRPACTCVEVARRPTTPCPRTFCGAFDRKDALDPARMLFFDTETTGLAGGTGTRAFMIGAADWHDGRACASAS